MQNAAFDDIVARFTGGDTPRVWSLLVTMFGEMAQAEGAEIPGAVLTRLTESIGIRPEATRVALHRLRKDGWIDSRRNGRSSDHGLTDWGRAQSAAATPRIYSADPGADAAWLILSDPAAPGGAPDGTVPLTAAIAIGRAPPADPAAFARRLDPGDPLPGWMSARVCPDETVAASAGLARRLDALRGMLPDNQGLDAMQIAVLRVLIVHSWRRIVLRAPELPDHVFPPGWRGADCRSHVAALLARLPRQTPAGLARLATA